MSCPIGTDPHYRTARCREPECRAAHAEKAREERRRRRNRKRREAGMPRPLSKGGRYGSPILCGHPGCGLEVEGCDGRYGEWMHTDSHREVADDGHLASPETAGSITRRAAQRKQTA